MSDRPQQPAIINERAAPSEKDSIMTDAIKAPGILLRTIYRLHADDAEQFSVLVSRMATDARKKSGCVFLDATRNIDDPTTFHLMEGWVSKEDIEGLMASEDFRSVLHEALKLRIVKRFGTLFVASGQQTLEMPT